MKNIGLPLIISFLLMACGGGSSGPGSLTLKYPDNDNQVMAVKSGGFYVSTKTWTKPDKKAVSSSHFICVANHDVDTSRGSISLGEGVKEGQTKVCFSLDGAADTNDESVAATGTYPVGKLGGDFAFSSISGASIRSFSDGKETKSFLNTNKATGDIKITSATADSIIGEINLADDKHEIKGTFTANAAKK